MIHKGNYGVVVVTEGKFKDRVGYYDDDKGPDAIVYKRYRRILGRGFPSYEVF